MDIKMFWITSAHCSDVQIYPFVQQESKVMQRRHKICKCLYAYCTRSQRKYFYLQYRVSNQCQGCLHIKCVIQIIIYYTKLHTTFELNGILFIFSWTEVVKRISAVIYCHLSIYILHSYKTAKMKIIISHKFWRLQATPWKKILTPIRARETNLFWI